jgi:hypothetical protein
MQSERGFFVRAAGFAGCAALLVQSMWDVPSHRWGTAGLALAALALACPLPSRAARWMPGRKTAFALAALALFWSVPFFAKLPFWSPTTAMRLEMQNAVDPGSVTDAELQSALRWFPLNPDLHYILGVRELSRPGGVPRAWRDLSVAAELRPCAWNLPAAAASMARPVSPGMALHFWALAVSRAGPRADSVFTSAWKNTVDTPDAAWFWTGFAWDNPRMLPLLALSIGDDNLARAAFEHWWKTRAFTATPDRAEILNFYHCLPRLGRREQLDEWMKRHPETGALDFQIWAGLLHEWRDDAAAWQVLARHIPEPPFPASTRAERVELLEARQRDDPGDWINAQRLVQHWTAHDAKARADQLCISLATTKGAPAWFVEKAAYAHAAAGRHTEAVGLLLRGM